MTRPSASWGLWSLVAALVTVLTSLARPAHGAEPGLETAAEELYWAFHACEEGMGADTTVVRRAQLLDDYRFRRARATRADASVLKTAKARDYVVRDWLQRCDVNLPKLAAQGRKQAAEVEAEAALAQCKTATDRGSLEQAEADYAAFKEKRQNAMKLDPKLGAKRGPAHELKVRLAACDKTVSAWIAKRRQVEDRAIKSIQDDANKTLASAQKEENDALGGTPDKAKPAKDGGGARLAVAIPAR